MESSSGTSENKSLLDPVTAHPARRRWRASCLRTYKLDLALAVLSIFACVLVFREQLEELLYRVQFGVSDYGIGGKQNLCPQEKALLPSKNGDIWSQLVEDKFSIDTFKTKAVGLLSGAVKIKTESYDDMGPVGFDPRWEAFGPFHAYLSKSFPLVHDTMSITKVNTWGLVYVWEGSDDTLNPIMLAAHQDVVPVNLESEDEWEYPSYSGHFDGEKIWGRGSTDDKSSLIGILASMEYLIEAGFKPARTIVMAFGFDEETSGLYGARMISDYLFHKFGKDGMAFIIDEGTGFVEKFGTMFAYPGVTEKGYLDVRIEVASPGGHSSVPPPHTSIGMLAALLVEYEANPFEMKIPRSSVTHDYFQCFAAHSQGMPRNLRKAILRSSHSDKALKQAESILAKDSWFKALAGTTQAADLINGGVKTNALPENAFAVVNHRIAVTSSVAEVISKDTALLKPLAEKFNLSFSAFGTQITDPSLPTYGSLAIYDSWGTSLEPAPVTPYAGKESAAYQLLSGTIKSVYNTHRGLVGDDNVKVQPGYMTGNTDTRYYWKLSPNIFRYNHQNTSAYGGIHTVNEFIEGDVLVEMIKFFATLVLNADESQDL